MQAVGVTALAPPFAPAAAPARQWPIVEGPDTPKLCLGTPFDEAGMRRVKQVGVDHLIGGGPRIPGRRANSRPVSNGSRTPDSHNTT